MVHQNFEIPLQFLINLLRGLKLKVLDFLRFQWCSNVFIALGVFFIRGILIYYTICRYINFLDEGKELRRNYEGGQRNMAQWRENRKTTDQSHACREKRRNKQGTYVKMLFLSYFHVKRCEKEG